MPLKQTPWRQNRMATRAQSRAGLSAVAARLAKAPAAPAWDKFENELLAISESGESRLEGTLLLRSLLKLAKRVGRQPFFVFFCRSRSPHLTDGGACRRYARPRCWLQLKA